MTTIFDLNHSDTETTVHEAFERMRRLFPGNPFLHIPEGSPGGSQEFTYEQTGSAVDEITTLYRDAGYSRHHHVALLLESRADFYLHWLALNNIGATLVPIGRDLVDEETTLVLQHGEVDLVVCLPSRISAAQASSQQHLGIAHRLLRIVRPPGTTPRARPAF